MSSRVAALAGLVAGIYSGAAVVEINAIALLGKRAAAGAVEPEAIEIANLGAALIRTLLTAAVCYGGVDLLLVGLLLSLEIHGLPV